VPSNNNKKKKGEEKEKIIAQNLFPQKALHVL
jgi:hypothetical protein